MIVFRKTYGVSYRSYLYGLYNSLRLQTSLLNIYTVIDYRVTH